jgi:hypothetical protein
MVVNWLMCDVVSVSLDEEEREGAGREVGEGNVEKGEEDKSLELQLSAIR